MWPRASAVLSIATLLVCTAWAIPPLPRKSPEFTISEPSGVPNGPDKQSLLSSYRGRVIVIGFVSTTCPHCQAFSQALTKLHKEFGPRFQPIDIAWNPDAKMLVPGFVKQFHLDFPVGYSVYDPIMSFMGFSVLDRPVVPLEVVIDKKGMIRAQSPPQGDANLQSEDYLRKLIADLLKEPVASKK